MLHTVDRKAFTLNAANLTATTEASTLDLPPGQFPDFLAVVDETGSGYLFLRAEAIRYAGEFCGFRYRSRGHSLELEVFND